MSLWPAPQSFRAQITIVCLASLAVIALAAILIRDVISRTESRLLAEARGQCAGACRELVRQHRERTAWGGDALSSQPLQAQDLSLRGLTVTVLRSYEGLEGGFYRPEARALIGHADGTGAARAPAARELELIASAARQAGASPVAVVGAWDRDLVVVAAAALEGGSGAAWALKRLSGARDPVGRRRQLWYGALALSAMLGVGALVSLWFALRSGVAQINAGLRRLEEDFGHRLPPIAGEFGEISRAINRMADRRTALEAELRRQDRLAALGKLVAGGAHEVRNPLNSVRLTLELLERRLRKGAVRGEEVGAAMREIDRLDGILARLLAFGRPAPAERRLQEISPLVRQAVGMVQEPAGRKGVRIGVESEQEGLAAEVDGAQIVQVLINLLLNAIEASPPGGLIRVRQSLESGRIVLSVTDQGPGIPEAVRPHIFEAFFTTRPEGSGLGLAVSREIAAAHGGSLEFDPGGPGATFRLLLPARRSTP